MSSWNQFNTKLIQEGHFVDTNAQRPPSKVTFVQWLEKEWANTLEIPYPTQEFLNIVKKIRKQ
jgi:hypothetical protein